MSEDDNRCTECGAFLTPVYHQHMYDSNLGIDYDEYNYECHNPRCPTGEKNLLSLGEASRP